MQKNILLTLVISLVLVTIGFASGNGRIKANTAPIVDQPVNMSSLLVPDTSTKHVNMADTNWKKAEESFSKTQTVVPVTTKKSSKTPLGKTKIMPTQKIDPLKPPQLSAGLKKAVNGDFQGAIIDFDTCIKKNYKNYNAYFFKAKALIELNKPKEALTNLDFAIEYNPMNPMFYYYRGNIYFDQGEIDSAYKDFDKAVTLKKDFVDALNYRGVTKEKKGKHAEAIEDYKAAIAINPQFATAYYNKGTSEAALTLYIDAVASFSKFVELDSTKTMGFMNRGNCYVMLKDYKLAVADYTKVIAIKPESSDAYYNRGAAYQLAGDQNSCIDWRKAESLGNKRATDMIKEYCK
jgi:tetratricopeptide (TPR) repeat protein